MRAFEIEQLYIYPIKSLGGIEVRSHLAKLDGFQFDRRWMLINSNNTMITQRDLPLLALFKVSLEKTSIKVEYNNQFISFDINQCTNIPISTKVWDDPVTVLEVDEQVSLWFSNILNRQIRLVKLNENSRIHHAKQIDSNIHVTLADGYPYLIVGTASMEHLQSVGEAKWTVQRFRPNIVLKTHIAHEEDEWNNLIFPTSKLKNIKPCGRCPVINIDPTTAISDKSMTKILATYRFRNNTLDFGTLMSCQQEGILQVGDSCYVS